MKNNKKFGAKGAVFAVALPVIATIYILSACALCFIFRPLALIIAAVAAFLYFNTAVIAFVLTAVLSRGKKEHKIKKGPVLGNIMYDKVYFANEPAFICDQNHKIVWSNRFASDSLGHKKVLGVNINSIFPYEFESENVIKKHKNVRVDLNGETYLVEETKINALDEVYYLLFLRNLTAQAELEQLQRDKEKIVAYVMVDNLDALLQYEQENYRETAAKIEKIVRSWAESVNGIIKEYDDIPAFPFKKTFDLHNPLQRSAFIMAIIMGSIHIASRIIYDLYYGLPSTLVDLLWMVTYYLSDVVSALIMYLIAIFFFVKLNEKDNAELNK